jgi:hypothetical protein
MFMGKDGKFRSPAPERNRLSRLALFGGILVGLAMGVGASN